MKIPKLRLVLLTFLPSVFSCFVITACTSERTVDNVTPTSNRKATLTFSPTETPSPTYTSTPNNAITLPKIREIPPGVAGIPEQTDGSVTLGQIYRCEPTKNKNTYRVTPSIAGSYGFLNAVRPRRNCLVPVTNKRCSYKDPDTSNKWYNCGRTPASDRGEFTLSPQGIGEVWEFSNGKEYHGFQSGVQFTFE
jgi:hypothetical protein